MPSGLARVDVRPGNKKFLPKTAQKPGFFEKPGFFIAENR